MPYLFVAVLLLLCLSVWWVVRTLQSTHAEYLIRERENAEGWQRLAVRLSESQTDAANRLLIRSGVAPAPKIDEERVAPAEIPHDLSDEEWAAEDEAAEINAHAREALDNPLKASLLEDAAKYDPHWQAVLARYRELKGQVN